MSQRRKYQGVEDAAAFCVFEDDPASSAPPVTGPLQKAALREYDRCMRSVEGGGDPEFWKRRIGRWLYDLKRAVYQCEQALAWLEQRRRP